MNEKKQRAFGTWDSPITPAALSTGLGLGSPCWDEDGSLLWLENRPDRSAVVVLAPDGSAARDLNSTYSARGGVGYGGGSFTAGGGQVFFVEARSGRIYCQPTAGGAPARPITPGFGACAAPTLSADGRWLLFIRTYEGQDSLELVDALGSQWPVKLAFDDDFLMQPAWRPDGEMICWVAWNHPNMPWDGTELHLGRLSQADGRLPALASVQTVAGGDEISIFQPEFSPDGRSVAYVSDESGWWQLYLYDLHNGQSRQLTHEPAEHGLPAWVQGMHTYRFAPDGNSIYCLRNRDASVSLWQIDLAGGAERRVEIDPVYSYLDQPAVSAHGIACIAAGSRTPTRVIARPLPGSEADGEKAGTQWRIVRRSDSEELAPGYYSTPETVEWRSASGDPVQGLFYPPHHPSFYSDGRPPLVVAVHGGPTGQAMRAFAPDIQYYTTRGFAVLDVNFRGSAGYGRAYRNLLRGNWGVVDVEDTVEGARNLVAAGRVDASRLVIMGGSSGGYTVLKALEDYPGFFKAGVCLYGISNQLTLAMDTHKFEVHYADRLIGPLPEAAELYRDRSPIFFAERIQDALALFQGEDDTSVPRSQLDEMVAVLRRRGVPHIYHVYPGEGHGFRKPETIAHYYGAVERFLQQYVVWA